MKRKKEKIERKKKTGKGREKTDISLLSFEKILSSSTRYLGRPTVKHGLFVSGRLLTGPWSQGQKPLC
jgi:hypothetical protein